MVERKATAAQTTGVERRREPRKQTNQPVILRAPGRAAEHAIEACVLDVSVHGVGLRSPVAVPIGAPVRLDAQGILLVGTVARCDPHGGAYNVGVQLSQPLPMLAEMEKLNSALLSDAPHS